MPMKNKLKRLIHRTYIILTIPFYIRCFWTYKGYDKDKNICNRCLMNKFCKDHMEELKKQ
jgi:hypothetical protein